MTAKQFEKMQKVLELNSYEISFLLLDCSPGPQAVGSRPALALLVSHRMGRDGARLPCDARGGPFAEV